MHLKINEKEAGDSPFIKRGIERSIESLKGQKTKNDQKKNLYQINIFHQQKS